MVAYMADSIVTADLPETSDWPGTTVEVEYEAGYVNGHWPNATQNALRFKESKRLVTIDVNGSVPSADVLDVENGDAKPYQAAVWIEKRIASGQNREYPGVIYCNRSNLSAVFNAMEAKGYKIARDFRTWIAYDDGHPEHPADMTGVTATQDWPARSTSGAGHYDLSIVYDTTWKAPATPKPPAPPTPPALKTIESVTVTYSDGTSVKI